MTDTKDLYVVRLYDRMAQGWIDCHDCQPCSLEEAEKFWNEQTLGGSVMTKFEDGDYYAIFSANTRMLFTPETLGR